MKKQSENSSLTSGPSRKNCLEKNGAKEKGGGRNVKRGLGAGVNSGTESRNPGTKGGGTEGKKEGLEVHQQNRFASLLQGENYRGLTRGGVEGKEEKKGEGMHLKGTAPIRLPSWKAKGQGGNHPKDLREKKGTKNGGGRGERKGRNLAKIISGGQGSISQKKTGLTRKKNQTRGRAPDVESTRG